MIDPNAIGIIITGVSCSIITYWIYAPHTPKKVNGIVLSTNPNYKKRAEENKERIIRAQVDSLKDKCLVQFNEDIAKGKYVTIVNFNYLDDREETFINEISEIVLKEMTHENPTLLFDLGFSYNAHYDRKELFPSLTIKAI